MKINTIAPLIFIFILIGCTSINAPTAITNIQPSPQASKALTLPAPTMTASPSASAAPEIDFPQGCINLSPADFNHSAFNGLLVVSDSRSNDHLLDPKTKQFLDVDKEGKQTFDPGILSPNKQYMLALTTAGDSYILRTADKVIKANMPTSDYWAIPRWLDNKHVSFLSLKTHNVIVLDPFTGKQSNIQLDLPNAKIMRETATEVLLLASIDPTLKRVFYNDQTGRFILWDIEGKKEMASLDSPAEEFWLQPSAWSPDGTIVAMPWPEGTATWLANDLFAFHTDGKIEKLTNLNLSYQFANAEGSVWSPDGNHIGFWLKISNTTNPNTDNLRQWLAILDTTTLKTRIYCLVYSIPSYPAFSIIWSPDSQQIIANIRLPNGDFQPTLVDVTYGTQSAIDGTQGWRVEDWMAP